MNYHLLTGTYWLTLVERLEQSRAAIESRKISAAQGRVVPGESDLVFGSWRRVKAAVLFLDISRFSSRPSETQWEQDILLRILSLFFSETVRIAEEYGGTVEKNTGDGLMAYFEDGGGNPQESGVTRAIASALTMFFATQTAINCIITNSHLEPIQFRVGIDYGWVTVAKLGSPRRFGSLVAIGTTANIACKMLDVAEPGDLVIGQAAKEELPAAWQRQFCSRIPRSSGWIYSLSKAEYSFYKYTGRWLPPRR